jgi:hypothetical protein
MRNTMPSSQLALITVVTVEELLVLDESQKTLVTTERKELDACFNRMEL